MRREDATGFARARAEHTRLPLSPLASSLRSSIRCGDALSSQSMAVIGGILGALIGFAIGILFTEEIFANNQSWPDVVPFALAIAGIFVGSMLGRRVRAAGP